MKHRFFRSYHDLSRYASRVAQREDLADGAVRVTASDGCIFTLRRLRPGAIEIKIKGYDTGKVGDAFLDLMTAEVGRHAPLEIFVDASEGTGVVTPVREAWTAWFTAHQTKLKHVTVLVSD